MAPKSNNKRKMDEMIISGGGGGGAAALDENEKVLYSLFQNVANNLSQLYAQSVNHQKLAFQAGENYAYVKLHKWMLEKLQDGRMVTVSQILTYLQVELDSYVSDVGTPGQGASGSQQNGASSDVAASSPSSAQVGQNQDMSHTDMQMDLTSDGN